MERPCREHINPWPKAVRVNLKPWRPRCGRSWLRPLLKAAARRRTAVTSALGEGVLRCVPCSRQRRGGGSQSRVFFLFVCGREREEGEGRCVRAESTTSRVGNSSKSESLPFLRKELHEDLSLESRVQSDEVLPTVVSSWQFAAWRWNPLTRDSFPCQHRASHGLFSMSWGDFLWRWEVCCCLNCCGLACCGRWNKRCGNRHLRK